MSEIERKPEVTGLVKEEDTGDAHAMEVDCE